MISESTGGVNEVPAVFLPRPGPFRRHISPETRNIFPILIDISIKLVYTWIKTPIQFWVFESHGNTLCFLKDDLMGRVIFHSDMNCYYASVEMMLDISLRGRAVAVCGSQETRHGIVLAKSQKAKEAGVKTGMAIWQAHECCPGLIVVPPQYDQYIKYSNRAHRSTCAILTRWSRTGWMNASST